MFYLSRAEQAALAALIVLLLVGSGLLVYEKGVQAGRTAGAEPLLAEPSQLAQEAPQPLPEADLSQAPAVSEVSASEPATAPRPRTAPTPPPSRPAGKLHLNAATAQELDTLPGIGPVYAKRILDYREQKRKKEGKGFEAVDELLNVAGIGPKRLAALRDYVQP